MKTIMKVFLRIHLLIFRLSKGTIGGQARGINILILNTKGNKSGKSWSVPLGYLIEDGNYIVVAFAGGSPKHPAWYYNLKSSPDVTIELPGGHYLKVHAEEASHEERERLWHLFKETVAQLEETYTSVKRTIPVMILHPQH